MRRDFSFFTAFPIQKTAYKPQKILAFFARRVYNVLMNAFYNAVFVPFRKDPGFSELSYKFCVKGDIT